MTDDGIFLRNSWYVAAWNHELIDGRKLARTILERPIVLYRGASGKVVALDDRCCHRAAPLSMGRIEGDDIRCMYHGMKFDPGGKCIQIPGQDMIPPKLGVRSYPVVERYNLIWIWTGDAEKADPNLIVDYPPLADPKWRGLPGYMHYKANWLLIVDNLSDFAHLAFVHTHTLGGSEETGNAPRTLCTWVPSGRNWLILARAEPTSALAPTRSVRSSVSSRSARSRS